MLLPGPFFMVLLSSLSRRWKTPGMEKAKVMRKNEELRLE